MAIPKLFKVVVAGEGGVGKTTLIKRFTTSKFTESKTTIGVAFVIANMQVEGNVVKLQIWDLGGEERFRNIVPNFCKGAHAAILVFDLTRYSSFLALPEWIDLIKNNTNNIPIYLVGSKADLVEYKSLSKEQALQFIKEYKLKKYFETSSKTGLNVTNLFNQIAKDLISLN
ncbi:MAG: Rab family GTPase [Candidatus Odinarchaeia archaeon]